MSATRLSDRVLTRLSQAEACETDPHYRDDLQIAKLTVRYAATGEAVYCSPHVLATYEVLGLHPDKVWPKIEARRLALGFPDQVFGRELPPKKPPQSAVGLSHVKLWRENTNGARAVNSRAAKAFDLGDQTRSVPMAAPSIAALYPNPGSPSSAKKRQFTLEELQHIVRYSGAPVSVRDLTLAALQARGPWPKQQGPATPVICVSIKGMQIEAGVVRSTIQRRIKRARHEQYWNRVRETNSWNDCPKCSAAREESKCGKCGYKGSRKNKGEYSPAFTYELNVEKFLAAPRCREIHSVNWRTYAEYKEAAKRGEHPNVTEMPRPTPAPEAAPPAKPEEPIRRTAQHQKERTVVNTEITSRSTKAAQLLMEMCGLADIGAIPQIAISIAAEAKYRGIEIEDAAKLIADAAIRDQQKGIALTRFYFRDLKWRSSDGRQTSASSARAEHNKRAIFNGLLRRYQSSGSPDSDEREDDPGRRGPSDGGV